MLQRFRDFWGVAAMAKAPEKARMARMPIMLLSILCLGCVSCVWKEPCEVMKRALWQMQSVHPSLSDTSANPRWLLQASESEEGAPEGEQHSWGKIGEGDQVQGSEEGGSEGGEGEGASEEEGEEAAEEAGEAKADLTVEDVVFNLAVSVVIFFGVDLGLLYVMKYRDKDIRSYVYRMISSTLSIFMAVMINAAIFSLIVEQFVPAAPPRGLGLHLEGHDEMLMNFI
eukprot:838746-Amphidinium_carterae.1